MVNTSKSDFDVGAWLTLHPKVGLPLVGMVALYILSQRYGITLSPSEWIAISTALGYAAPGGEE